MSGFYRELLELCQKHDPQFPRLVSHLHISVSSDKLVDWKVQAVEFGFKEKT